jgi:hypothetical protein
MVWSAQLALLLGVGAAIYLLASHLLGLDTFRQLLRGTGASPVQK